MDDVAAVHVDEVERVEPEAVPSNDDFPVDGEGSSRGDGPDEIVETPSPDSPPSETVDGDASDEAGPAPNAVDMDIIDVMGQAVGVTFEAGEELNFLDKVERRDQHRWELDPASDEPVSDETPEKEPATP